MKKWLVYLRWILVMVIKIVAWIPSFFLWHPAFLLRDLIRKNRTTRIVFCWLWIWLDDEEDFGEHWWLEKNNLHMTYWTAWRWSYLRNNSWNLNNILIVPHGLEVIEEGCDTSWMNDPLQHCRFKWQIIRGHRIIEGWDVNQGDRLSQGYSNLGKASCWYYGSDPGISRIHYLFRKSYAGVWRGLMINYKLGWNDRGHALVDLKIRIWKKRYADHWVPEGKNYKQIARWL